MAHSLRMDRPSNPKQNYDFSYVTENPNGEALYLMKDTLGHFQGVPCGRVEYALLHGLVFENEKEVELYERENRDAPSVRARRIALLSAVEISLEYEQWLRNRVAAQYGWPHHPNDMDWLDDEQRRNMLNVFSERGPFKDEWLKPDGFDAG